MFARVWIIALALGLLGTFEAALAQAYPRLPTVAESGLPGFAVDSWNGLLAPAGTPTDIIDTLNAAIVSVVKLPGSAEAMFKNGMEPLVTTPAQFSVVIARETQRWAKLVQEKRISLD